MSYHSMPCTKFKDQSIHCGKALSVMVGGGDWWPPYVGVLHAASPISNSCCWRGDSQLDTIYILFIDIGNRLRESRSCYHLPLEQLPADAGRGRDFQWWSIPVGVPLLEGSTSKQIVLILKMSNLHYVKTWITGPMIPGKSVLVY